MVGASGRNNIRRPANRKGVCQSSAGLDNVIVESMERSPTAALRTVAVGSKDRHGEGRRCIRLHG